ncbi:MAG: ATP-binding protein [Anaerolineae bacterium]|nr:ATP-binding protein [Anaerolineae bacterium]MCI0610900.1 ATP-binding protein [Anaerolineae bacterium]
MRSISTKLILAFLSIGIVSVAIIAFTALWNTRLEFIRFLSDRNQSDIATELTNYYQITGSWKGAGRVFRGNPPSNMPHPPAERGPSHYRPFVLTDQNGIVIIPNDRYKIGDQIPPSAVARGERIMQNGEIVGILVPIRVPFQGNTREVEFIQRTSTLLLYGALIGAVIALLLGTFLSHTLTRPIRELTQATHAVSEGDLSQQVPVRSNDELGELAQAFNKMSAELSRSVSARKQMTADIAHELRTPLSLILGHAEAVHDGVLPPTRENFEIIREEAARLEHLVNDLRTLSLADAGELTINLQTIEPGRLIQEVASLYQYQTQRKNITLDLDIASPLSTIEVDPGRMTQVLTNIMDNAFRHTPEGGQIILSAKEVDDQIEIAIQDSGPGLKAEDLDRIFERFYRTDSARQREDTGGSGLGLAIAKSIVQAHGGQLSARSEAGKGLKIMIRLPVKYNLLKPPSPAAPSSRTLR